MDQRVLRSPPRNSRPCLALAIVAVSLLGAFYPETALGLGFRIPNQDAEAIGRANAFVATADNPAAIYYNPAGITQLPGQNLQIGALNYFGINTEFVGPTGMETDNKFEVLPVPQLHYTYSLETLPLSFGLGFYAPYGLGVKWPDESGFRSLAMESRIKYLTANPVIAWKIHPKLSLAAGLTFNYSEIMFRRGLATPNDILEFKGHDLAYGFNAGLLWQPHSQWSFGLNYRSATTVDYEGSTSYNPGTSIPATHTTGRLEYPQIICAGVSYRPTPKWNIEFDIDWANWSTLDAVTLEGTQDLFGQDLVFPLGWHDSWFYEIGVTRYFAHGWYISAGYFFSTDTASERFYNPGIPDTDLHVGTIGVGFKGKHWTWALAGQIIAGPARDIHGSLPNPLTGESADGSYQLTVPAVTASVGYRF